MFGVVLGVFLQGCGPTDSEEESSKSSAVAVSSEGLSSNGEKAQSSKESSSSIASGTQKSSSSKQGPISSEAPTHSVAESSSALSHSSSSVIGNSSSQAPSSSSEIQISSVLEVSSSSSVALPVGAPLRTNVRNYIFGHSLINHEHRVNPVPSQETSVPHWMALMAEHAGYEYSVSGQYGFLAQHLANLPPTAQWGFDVAEPAWVDWEETFAEADFNTALITAANFIQWMTPNDVLWGEDPETGPTPVTATAEISGWLDEQEPGIQVYIYENWPDMGGRAAAFPPTETEWAGYVEYAKGDFHSWWLEYHDGVKALRPDLDIKMIPVGPILLELIDSELMSAVPLTEIFEDDSPHGRPTCYFIAAIITYRAMYGVLPPASYVVPEIIHQGVRDNYHAILAYVEKALQDNHDNEGGRVY